MQHQPNDNDPSDPRRRPGLQRDDQLNELGCQQRHGPCQTPRWYVLTCLFNPHLSFQLGRPVATCWTRSPRMRKTQSRNLARWTSSAKTGGLCRSLSPKRIHSPPGSASPGSSCTSCSSSSSSTRGNLALCSRTTDRRLPNSIAQIFQLQSWPITMIK